MSKTSICSSCSKTFFGTTNRRAKRPLDQPAVAKANKKIETDCDRLDDSTTGNARNISMRRDDYLCRRVWMDAYLEALENEPEKTIPKEKKRPEDPVNTCPLVGPVDPDVECVAVHIVAFCEHKGSVVRSAAGGGVLEVVPSSTYGADNVVLEAKMQRACGEHPIWSVTGETNKTGVKQEFAAKADVTSKLWIPSANPKKYVATCISHACTRRVEIHAYPPNKLWGSIDLKNSLTIVRQILKGLEKGLDTVADRFQWKYLEGRGVVEANWKEHTDERAFYAYNISVKLLPLFGADFKVTFGPSKITKLVGKIPGVGKYVKKVVNWLIKAGLYFKLSGGILVDLAYKRDQPEQPDFVDCVGTGLGGRIRAAIGVEGGIVDDLLKVELEANGTIKAGGSPFINNKGVGLGKFEVTFDGLKGNCKLILLWGVVSVNKTVNIIGPMPIYGPKNLYLGP